MRYRTSLLLAITMTGALCTGLVFTPAACAANTGTSGGGGGLFVPVAFLGLPSLHSIIEAIAKGFFSALAGALVPGFLKHGTVATIQHLVALPDPARWGHVSGLESDMTYLGMSLMPVTLTVCALRYWMMGLTGTAHPVSAIGRCAGATGVLVMYRWLVEQTVAATNTLTHTILAFPVVANGLASIITVLFGGALLVGAGGVFGAFLVIIGVLFAAGLFASQELLTVVLALTFAAGPPLIALSPIPELSHLARAWAHALMVIVLVPLGWTVLFAVAGALTLDASSFTNGASGGLPGHIAAAFAGLITFVLAVKLPLMLLGELRHILGGAHSRAPGASAAQGPATMPGVQRMQAAHARLRSTAAFEGALSLGSSAGRAAGALGAPAGGPLGATRRGLTTATGRTGLTPNMTAPANASTNARDRTRPSGKATSSAGAAGGRGGVRERFSRARTILTSAPRDARAAMAGSSRNPVRASARSTAAQKGARGQTRPRGSNTTGGTPARVAPGTAKTSPSGPVPVKARPGSMGSTSARVTPRVNPAPAPVIRAPVKDGSAASSKTGTAPAHPGRKVTSSAGREASTVSPVRPASKPGRSQQPPKLTPSLPVAPSVSRVSRRKRRPAGGGGR